MQNVVIDHGVASGWKASVFQLDQSFKSVLKIAYVFIRIRVL